MFQRFIAFLIVLMVLVLFADMAFARGCRGGGRRGMRSGGSCGTAQFAPQQFTGVRSCGMNGCN